MSERMMRGLGLAALAQEDHVVPGEQRVLELRQDGVLVAEHAGEQRLAGEDAGDGVARISSLTGTDSQPDSRS